MALQTGLVPNPHRSGVISHVIILNEQGGEALCLDPSAFNKRPELLRPYNPGYFYALKLWYWVSALIALGGIPASFFWHWWAFLVGWALSYGVHRANLQSAGQFALQTLKEHDGAAEDFGRRGALFFTPAALIQRRRG